MTDAKSFYDAFAAHYDVIFEDWDASMQRQGSFIADLIARELPGRRSVELLDAAAGIGTQSLPLAQRGFRVVSRDLSPMAIDRLKREAQVRGLTVDAGVADMRAVDGSLSDSVDVVLAFDNSVPHLPSNADILASFEAFHRCLKPNGICLLSVRDYDATTRGKDVVHAYGVRLRDSVRHVPVQVWRWLDEFRYELSLYIVVESSPHPSLLTFVTQYYAIPVNRLLELLVQAGFVDCRRIDESIYQPIIVARRPPSNKGPQRPPQ